MRVTNNCNKTLALAACALILLGDGAVWASESGNHEVEITFDSFVTKATGSLVAARYSQDATQYISCQVSAAVSNNTLEMSCEARDALGNTFSCRSK